MSEPRGILVAIGGAEDKEDDMVVLRRVVDMVRGEAQRVVVIPTASSIPEEAAKPYLSAFGELGLSEVRVLDIRARDETNEDEYVEAIGEADIIYFTGGDQLRLTSILGGSPILDAIRRRHMEGGVVAGTSAGAAAMSATMIFQGEAHDGSMHKGNVQMTPGLGLVPHGVIDTHFVNRGRFSRLLEVVSANPGLTGIGIGENTGIIYRDGGDFEVVGEGLVVVVDGHEVQHTNIADVRTGAPISTQHLIVHTLGDGYHYHIAERAYSPPTREKRKVSA